MSVAFEYIARNYLSDIEYSFLKLHGINYAFLKLKLQLDKTFSLRCHLLFRQKWFLRSTVFSGNLKRSENENVRLPIYIRRKIRLDTESRFSHLANAESDLLNDLHIDWTSGRNRDFYTRLANQLSSLDILISDYASSILKIQSSEYEVEGHSLPLNPKILNILTYLGLIYRSLDTLEGGAKLVVNDYLCLRYGFVLNSLDRDMKSVLQKLELYNAIRNPKISNSNLDDACIAVSIMVNSAYFDPVVPKYRAGILALIIRLIIPDKIDD